MFSTTDSVSARQVVVYGVDTNGFGRELPVPEELSEQARRVAALPSPTMLHRLAERLLRHCSVRVAVLRGWPPEQIQPALLTLAADPKHLGARIAITSVLHTWGSAMTHHPHVHMIVPGGGLSEDGKQWIANLQANVFGAEHGCNMWPFSCTDDSFVA